MIVLKHPQGSEDWLRARAGAITASRFADARSRLKKASRDGRRKAGDFSYEATSYAALIALETIAREPLDETFVTYRMRRGRDLEPMARRVYEARTKALVEEVSLILTDDERFGYSADGLVEDDGLVEIKCPMAAEKLLLCWEDPDNAHWEYVDQINGGLWITGRKWCDLVVYCPWLESVGKDLFVKRIYRNDDAINELEADLLQFMHLVDHNLAILREPRRMSGRRKDEPTGTRETPPWDVPSLDHTTGAALSLPARAPRAPAPTTTPANPPAPAGLLAPLDIFS